MFFVWNSPFGVKQALPSLLSGAILATHTLLCASWRGLETSCPGWRDLLELQSASARPYQPLHATGRNLTLALLLPAQLQIVACAIFQLLDVQVRCEVCQENQGLCARVPGVFVWVCPSCCSVFQEHYWECSQSRSPRASRGRSSQFSGSRSSLSSLADFEGAGMARSFV